MSLLDKKDTNKEKKDRFWLISAIVFLCTVGLWYLFALFHPLHAINQDLGRYIAITKYIFSTNSIPSLNLFSYTNPDFSFVASHWLGGVLLTLITYLVGFSGLVVVKAMIIFSAFLGVLYLGYKRSHLAGEYSIILISLLAIPTTILLLERTHARPEIFSHLFFVAILLLLYSKKKYALWFIPLIMFAWVNVHIYFIIGFLLIGAYFIESAFVERLSQRTKTLFGVGLASLAVSFLNPAGLSGILYPFNVFKNYGYTIVENQTPFFLIPFDYHHGTIAVLFIMILLLFVSTAINWRRLKISDVIVSLGLVYLSVSAIRHVFIFAVGIFPILVYNLSSVIERVPKTTLEKLDLNMKSFWRSVVVVGVCVFVFLGGRNLIQASVEASEHALGAVNFVVQNDIDGNMFNNFDIGGYLIYKLYPDRLVFVDNRPEAYPSSFFIDVYKPMQQSAERWREVVEEYNITYVVFGTTDQTPWGQNFISMIVGEKDWTIVYADAVSLVAVKNDAPENARLMKAYGF